MLASELRKRLSQLIKQYGDRPIVFVTENGNNCDDVKYIYHTRTTAENWHTKEECFFISNKPEEL